MESDYCNGMILAFKLMIRSTKIFNIRHIDFKEFENNIPEKEYYPRFNEIINRYIILQDITDNYEFFLKVITMLDNNELPELDADKTFEDIMHYKWYERSEVFRMVSHKVAGDDRFAQLALRGKYAMCVVGDALLRCNFMEFGNIDVIQHTKYIGGEFIALALQYLKKASDEGVTYASGELAWYHGIIAKSYAESVYYFSRIPREMRQYEFYKHIDDQEQRIADLIC